MTVTSPDPTINDSGAPRATWRATPSGTPLGLRVLDSLLRFLPLRVAEVLVWPLVLMWFIHFNHPRIAVQRAMQRMGRRPTLWYALRAYFAYSAVLVERWHLMSGRLRPTLDREGSTGIEIIEQAVAGDGALVFLGGHCGALEFGSVALEELGRPVRPVAVADPGAGALLSGVGDPAKGIGGQSSTIVADGTVRSGLKMLKALRAGEILCFKADRVLPGTDDETVEVPFFGERVPVPRGPVRIALTARATAVVVSVFRVGVARYRVVADPLDLDGRDPDEVTARFVALLEEQIANQPHQWFNFYPYWSSDAAVVAEHPEEVPLSARAAEHALWGAVAASTALLGLDAVLGDSLLWALPAGALAERVVAGLGAVSWGMAAGVIAGGTGILVGGEKSLHGRRNLRAHAAAWAAPLVAVAGPLLLGAGLLQAATAQGWAAAAVAAAWGLAVGALGPSQRIVALAAVTTGWIAAFL